MGTHTEAMDPPLLPCPFCGSADVDKIDRHFPEDGAVTWSVLCDQCGAGVDGTEWLYVDDGKPGFLTPAEAAFAWNLRGGKPGGRLDG